MQVAVARSDMRVGEEEDSECGWYKHNESEVNLLMERSVREQTNGSVEKLCRRSLGAEEGGYFHRESDISMSVLKRKVQMRCRRRRLEEQNSSQALISLLDRRGNSQASNFCLPPSQPVLLIL